MSTDSIPRVRCSAGSARSQDGSTVRSIWRSSARCADGSRCHDTHVHAAPDVLDRIGDDAFVAESYGTADVDGFVLKGHYESTVGRAHAVADPLSSRRAGVVM